MTHDANTAEHKHRGAVQSRILAMIRPGVAYATGGIALALGTPRGSTRQALDRLTALGAIVRRMIGPDCVFWLSGFPC
ncbi:MAG: hypothetical protein RJA36_1848 [Pseudomonadota bacterium]|jgi:DNA-binding GntR family transcriptional regulator